MPDRDAHGAVILEYVVEGSLSNRRLGLTISQQASKRRLATHDERVMRRFDYLIFSPQPVNCWQPGRPYGRLQWRAVRPIGSFGCAACCALQLGFPQRHLHFRGCIFHSSFQMFSGKARFLERQRPIYVRLYRLNSIQFLDYPTELGGCGWW
jgi:hypothetical protein